MEKKLQTTMQGLGLRVGCIVPLSRQIKALGILCIIIRSPVFYLLKMDCNV